MNYSLFHRNIEQRNEDFPNLSGFFKANDGNNGKHKLVDEYINYSIESDALFSDDENNWLEFIEREESKYIELIESEVWKLVDENGKIHKILIPNFLDKNEIIFRWNV